MKYKNIKDLDQIEIFKRIKEHSIELFQIKMKKKMGSVSNPLKIRILRRNIARLKTALSQRNLKKAIIE